MFKKKRMFVLISMMVFFTFLCSSGYAAPEKPGLLIPIGRLVQNGNDVQMSINSDPFEPSVIEDGSGGYWFKIPFDKLKKEDKITLKVIKTTPNNSFHEEKIHPKKWTTTCPLIDSNDPKIVAKAKELTKGCIGNNEKVKKVLDFVVNQIKFQLYPGMHFTAASDTLKYGYGICVNHSRLFVALCRAVGIPARTVSGTMVGLNNTYDHHEWAEFYDDDRNWHPLEPLFSTDIDFVDLRRIDLIYDIESNPVYPFLDGWEVNEVKLKNNNVSIFCPNWSLQQRTGQMSFQMLNDKYPESVEVKVEYDMSKYIN